MKKDPNINQETIEHRTAIAAAVVVASHCNILQPTVTHYKHVEINFDEM